MNQPAAVCADPQTAIAIGIQGAALNAWSNGFQCIVANAKDSAVPGDPGVTVTVLIGLVGRPGRADVAEGAACLSKQAVCRGEPHGALATLNT